MADVVIVGAGHSGAETAIALRRNGFAGSIRIIGRESDPPYERPPLSKSYLARNTAFDRMLIRTPQDWWKLDVALETGQAVTAVDPATHHVTLANGGIVAFRYLVWAAGGTPRRLACQGAELSGVHVLRTRADADGLMDGLDAGARRLVIIGGGYIGLETAAALTALGRAVTVLEAMPRVLARVCGEELSAFCEAEHRARGVDIRTNVRVVALEGGAGRVQAVVPADGSTIPADLVLVGIGIIAEVGPLLDEGAACGDGVLVDDHCRTSLPDVYAVGDCAAHANAFAQGAVIRLESVQNAVDMANSVASDICGDPQPYRAARSTAIERVRWMSAALLAG